MWKETDSGIFSIVIFAIVNIWKTPKNVLLKNVMAY